MVGPCKKLIIVDPSLRNLTGHHFALTSLVANEASNFGFNVFILANKSLQQLPEINNSRVLPVFSVSMYDAYKKNNEKVYIKYFLNFKDNLRTILPSQLKSFISSGIRLVCADKYLKYFGLSTGNISVEDKTSVEIVIALDEISANENDLLLVHTADARMYRAILRLLLNRCSGGGYPSIHLCTSYDMGIMPHGKSGLQIKRVIDYFAQLGFLGKKLHLYAENSLLAENLSDEWGVDVKTLEIPVPQFNRSIAVDEESDDVFTIIYLGAAREEKGFLLLPEIIKIISQKKNLPRVKFVIQCTPQVVGYTKKIIDAVNLLREMPNDIVELIDEPLSMSEYYSKLDKSDLVLMLYDKKLYRVRGSGIAAEAIAYGKLVIATPDTFPAWMAGDAAILADSTLEAASVITEVVKNKDRYTERAIVRMNEYRESNSPESYIKHLLSENLLSSTDEIGSEKTIENDMLSYNDGDNYHDESVNNEIAYLSFDLKFFDKIGNSVIDGCVPYLIKTGKVNSLSRSVNKLNSNAII